MDSLVQLPSIGGCVSVPFGTQLLAWSNIYNIGAPTPNACCEQWSCTEIAKWIKYRSQKAPSNKTLPVLFHEMLSLIGQSNTIYWYATHSIWLWFYILQICKEFFHFDGVQHQRVHSVWRTIVNQMEKA